MASSALALYRALLNLSFAEPRQILTSGLEEEALFSIWKYVQGQPVFSDPFSIPFSASYFNWLFYSVYGSVTGFVLQILELRAEWIPTVTHVLSFVLAACCVPVSILVIRDLNDAPGRHTTWLGAVAGVLVAFNPLVGWWNLTARPDIGALLLELASLLACIRYAKSGRKGVLVAAVLLAFFAWSFRQVSVNVIGGFCLFLAVAGKWRALLTAGTLTFALYGATFLANGPDYWSNTVTCLGASEFFVRHGLENLVGATQKAPLLLAGGAALVVATFRRGWRSSRPAMRLLLLTFTFSTVWNLVTSMKIGASHNYFMAPVAMAVLAAVVSVDHRGVGQLNAPASAAWLRAASGWLAVAQVLSCLVVLLGAAGRIDLRDDQLPAVSLRQTLVDDTGPTLATERWLNLPWISPASPHFVYAYVYRVGPLANHAYEGGGIEGLIQRRFFATIIVPKRQREAPWSEIGENYVLRSEDSLFLYFQPEP